MSNETSIEVQPSTEVAPEEVAEMDSVEEVDELAVLEQKLADITSKKSSGSSKVIKTRGDYNGQLKLSAFPVDVFDAETQELLINMPYREATEHIITAAGGDITKWVRKAGKVKLQQEIQKGKEELQKEKDAKNSIVSGLSDLQKEISETDPQFAKQLAELLKLQ